MTTWAAASTATLWMSTGMCPTLKRYFSCCLACNPMRPQSQGSWARFTHFIRMRLRPFLPIRK